MSPSGFPGYPTPLDGAPPVAQASATRVSDKKATVRTLLRERGLPGVLAWGVFLVRPRLLRVASVVLFVAAVGFGWLAFTRFDDGEPPQPGSPGYRGYEDQRLRQAQLSVALG